MTKLFSLFKTERLKAFLAGLCLLFVTTVVSAQNCDCPAIATCAPCDDDVTSLSMRYDGTILPAIITVTDGGGHVVFGPQLVLVGGTFTFSSDSPTDSFRSHEVTISGNLDILGSPLVPVLIETDCDDPIYVGSEYGSFTVVSGISMGGPLS